MRCSTCSAQDPQYQVQCDECTRGMCPACESHCEICDKVICCVCCGENHEHNEDLYVYGDWDLCGMDADSDHNVWRSLKLGTQWEVTRALAQWVIRHEMKTEAVNEYELSYEHWFVREDDWELHGYYDSSCFVFKKVS